ncbi:MULTISPECIES: LacI family DNA-binding transcriptional regulator [Actinomycetes]
MPHPRTRATMKDVAQLAGVSPKTVSNVLTGAVAVREGTRERVQAAMDELDFVPNLSARGLRNGRTGIIGVALPDLATAFSADLAHTIVEQAHERGLAVQFEETAAEPEREHDLVSRARTHLIDGLILNPVRLEDSVIERVDHLPPVVLIGEVEQHRADRVYVDSRVASREITEHVLSRGARRIAALGGAVRGQDGKATAGLRLLGYLDALRDAGLEADPQLQVDVEQWTIGGAAAAVEELLARQVPFDAVVAFTDTLAFGALHALHRAGLRVPEDVLVTGFDDVEHAAFTLPPLTTVAFTRTDYVSAALDLLSARFEERAGRRDDGPSQAVVIPHRLVLRESTQGTPAGYVPTGSP